MEMLPAVVEDWQMYADIKNFDADDKEVHLDNVFFSIYFDQDGTIKFVPLLKSDGDDATSDTVYTATMSGMVTDFLASAVPNEFDDYCDELADVFEAQARILRAKAAEIRNPLEMG